MTAFHRALNGEAPIPEEHYIGRLSEEFGGALPRQVIAEIEALPAGYLDRIVEYRRYRDAWLMFGAVRNDQARRQAFRAGSELNALVEQIAMELDAEAMGLRASHG